MTARDEIDAARQLWEQIFHKQAAAEDAATVDPKHDESAKKKGAEHERGSKKRGGVNYSPLSRYARCMRA